MSSTTPSDLRARNLRMLAVLAGLFLLPLLLAFYMYYATDWRPVKRVNHGTLIIPIRELPVVHLPRVSLSDVDTPPTAAESDSPGLLHTKWSMVYIGAGNCDEPCRQALYVMRQTRLSLNNEMSRVDRIFLTTGSCCAREFLAHEHPGLVVLDATSAQGSRLLHEFPADGRPYSLFIVDPLGNLMMSYDARQNPKGLLEDLQKLLRLSHIG
ncbi:MAG: SCO family protein [Steroidobacteraceae bacterium]